MDIKLGQKGLNNCAPISTAHATGKLVKRVALLKPGLSGKQDISRFARQHLGFLFVGVDLERNLYTFFLRSSL